MEFKVQKKQCKTCIYRKDSPLNLKDLEDQIRDNFGGFKTYRVCHHSEKSCCAGFWANHKNEFQLGQIIQRLDLVKFVEEDNGVH